MEQAVGDPPSLEVFKRRWGMWFRGYRGSAR